VNPDNNQENKDVLEGHLHIVIFWNMAVDRCGHIVAFERISKRCAHYQDWRWTKDVPERHFHIIIFWNMAIDRWGYTNECNWIVKRCTPPRLVVEQCYTGKISSYRHLAKDALHRLSMGDKSNIIDEAEIFLFTIYLDELRGICWKEH